jgi:ABC-type multidrug transport system fused ATPase/permease subunit
MLGVRMNTQALVRYSIFHRFPVRVLIIVIAFVAAVAGLLSPFFQKIFIDRLLGAEVITHGYAGFEWLESVSPLVLIAGAFFATLLGQGLSLFATFIGIREGTILQGELSEALYRKTLSIRADRMAGMTVGEVVSIYATDVPGSTALVDQALPTGAGVLFPLVFAPLAIYWICGFPLWAAIGVMIAIVGLLISLAVRQARFFFRFKQLAAERTGLVNEWIQNMRLLRILGWIEEFEAKIFKKRIEETENRVLMVTNGQLMGAVGSSISFVINLAGVATLVFFRKDPVTPGELFALLWIFGVFLARPFRQIAWIFTFTFDSLTSIRRLERFFARPSDEDDEVIASVDDEALCNDSCNNESPASIEPVAKVEPLGLKVRGLNLAIRTPGSRGEKTLLHDVNFDVQPGEFIAVVGEVGAGKSLLILSLMGETGATFDSFTLEKDSGVAGEAFEKNSALNALALSLNDRRGKFAFVPQEGFVMSASLRENVMFRYDVSSNSEHEVLRALDAAQFKLQSEHLPDGLETEIGERGVNLSGGQRQRVSLARAGFFNRSIILLDDCLSAVDVDTEDKLIRDLIDGVWSDRTRILVTHRLSVLDRVDRVFFMEDGRIIDQGPFRELVARNARVREFVASVERTEGGVDGEAKSVS